MLFQVKSLFKCSYPVFFFANILLFNIFISDSSLINSHDLSMQSFKFVNTIISYANDELCFFSNLYAIWFFLLHYCAG